jgi:simple sugar transport system ATP-binding protein/ribose transport system ATP-binding protein
MTRGAALSVSDVHKRYGALHALKGVSLTVGSGEVRGLVGENGAGKSTLGKIIAGAATADSGRISLDGGPVHYRTAVSALNHGLAMIAQELAVVPSLTVAENVMLGQEPRHWAFTDRKQLRDRFGEICDRVGFFLPPDARLGSLRRSDQQKAEILRAVARDARLIVMDEPTAALSSDDARRLLAVTRRLADEGRTIIFVSHHLKEVLEVCDDVTVLRDGQIVHTRASNIESPASLVTAMIGTPLGAEFPEKVVPERVGEPALRVSHLASSAGVIDATFEVWPGEVVGIAGLVGSGRSELARAVFGADRHTGTIEVAGREVRIKSVRNAIASGIAMLPENRKDLGLLLGRSVAENVSLPRSAVQARSPFLRRRREHRDVAALLSQVGVRNSALRASAGSLSGGNQQKVMFAKWLMTSPRIFIADEPTQGVDIAAKSRIYELIAELTRRGMAVVLISSELEEVIGLAHRVLVMRRGCIVHELAGAAITASDVLTRAFDTEQDAA